MMNIAINGVMTICINASAIIVLFKLNNIIYRCVIHETCSFG